MSRWDEPVWAQSWPGLDPTTNLELKVLANNQQVASLQVKWPE